MTMQLLNSAAALVFVLCLIGIISLLVRKYLRKDFTFYRNPKDKRLQVSESLHLDQKRKLVLVRRDETEHLLLISSDDNLVIEKDIVKEEGDEKNK